MRTDGFVQRPMLTIAAGATAFPAAFMALQTGACSRRWTHLQSQTCTGGPDSSVLKSIAAWRSAGCAVPITRSGLCAIVL